MTPGSRAQSARPLPAALLLAAGLCAPCTAATPPPLPDASTPPAPASAPKAKRQPISRPQSARRLVRFFDFEEPDNPHPVPDHWFHAQDNPADDGARRPGFPRFNQAVFDASLACSGTHSVKLPTQGGSTALRLDPGEIPVFPGADYAVSAKIRTADLEHARAFLIARLLDQHLRPIPGSEVRSEPALSPAQWLPVTVAVPGNWPEAAFLQIDLDLLQPREFQPALPDSIAKLVGPREDVAGAAYFDDVAVALVPRTRFWTENPAGIFLGAEAPTLNMQARDQGGENLRATVRVLDADGRTLDSGAFVLDPSARTRAWTPKLPGYGWFRAVLDIDASDLAITHSEVSFAHLPAPQRRTAASIGGVRDSDLARFGVAADALPEPALAQLPGFLERAGTRFVSIPAYDPAMPPEQARAALATRSPIIERLLTRGQEVTVSVASVPTPIAHQETLDPGDTLAMAALDRNAWTPYLDATLDIYGQRILRYQLGPTGDMHALRRDPTEGVEKFRDAIARLVPGPRVCIPWRADYPPPAAALSSTRKTPALSGAVVAFPLGFASEAMHDAAAQWRDAMDKGVEVTMVPELPDARRFGARARAVEAARRIADFWAAFGTPAPGARPARIALDAPWTLSGEPEDLRLSPRPELPVLAQMAARLASRRLIVAAPAPPGVHAMLFAEPSVPEAGGVGGQALTRACIVAWTESATPEHAWIDAYPARDGVDVVDIFGNSTHMAAPAPGDGRAGAGGSNVRVPLTDAPVFIEGVDPYLAQFTSSLHLTPTFIPAVIAEHEEQIQLTNPWPVRITGQLQLKEIEAPGVPGGPPRPRSQPWSISPNLIDFAAAPGQTISLPITVSLAAGQLAGTQDVAIIAKVLADRPYAAIRATTTVEIGLPDLELIPEAQLAPTPSGPDVIVTAAVTNRDSKPRSLRLELAGKDIPSQQRDLSDLPPGETVFKRFILQGGAAILSGKHVRVTLSDDESAARLSKAALVPDVR